MALATIIARAGKAGELRTEVERRYGLDLPTRPVRAQGAELNLVWAGPEQWLAVSADPEIVKRLAADLRGFAAVSDQSDARAIIRIAGPRARNVLAKGCPVDLHPRAFRAGDTALTAIEHIGVHLWQLDGLPTFEIAVARSRAASFWRWFSASALSSG
jgi:sarcosine oxidase subunit gamma